MKKIILAFVLVAAPALAAGPTPILQLVIPTGGGSNPAGTEEIQTGATLTIDAGGTAIFNNLTPATLLYLNASNQMSSVTLGSGLTLTSGTLTVSGSGSAVWGDITGTLSSQTDLQSALDGKLSLSGGTLTGNLTLGGNHISIGGGDSAIWVDNNAAYNSDAATHTAMLQGPDGNFGFASDGTELYFNGHNFVDNSGDLLGSGSLLSGVVTSLNTLTGSLTLTTTSTGTANSVTPSGNTITVNIGTSTFAASAGSAGTVTAGGSGTFTGTFTGQGSGTWTGPLIGNASTATTAGSTGSYTGTLSPSSIALPSGNVIIGSLSNTGSSTPSNAPGGPPLLDSTSNVSQFNMHGLTMRIFQPTTTAGGTVTPITNTVMVGLGDSIMGGGLARVAANTYYQAPVVTNATGWSYMIGTLGFCKNMAVFQLGMGGSTLEQGTAQLYNSQGQTCSVNIANGASTGTIVLQPGWIIPGSIFTEGLDFPTNTTGTFTQIRVTGATTSNASGTITVPSTTGITPGMWVSAMAINVGNANAGTPFLNQVTGTVTNVVDSTHVVVSVTPGASTPGTTLIFTSPVVTFSNPFGGGTGTKTMTSGGTLLTGTAVFTKGSATVTCTIPGLAPSAIWLFPMGSHCTLPGSYFIATPGTGTFTLNSASDVTSSGTVTLWASATVFDPAGNTTLYPNNINTTVFLLSPQVTGGTSYLVDNYGINNALAPTSTATFATDYTTQIADVVAMGYHVVYSTIVPPASNNGLGHNVASVNAYNSWLTTANLPGAFFWNVQALFPPGNVTVPEDFHSPDGIHPNDLGHQTMAWNFDDFCFAAFGSTGTTTFITSPLSQINDTWLSQNVPLKSASNQYGGPTFQGTQTFYDAATVTGYSGDNGTLNVLAGSGAAADIYFGLNNFGVVTNYYRIHSTSTALAIVDPINGGGLTLPVSPNSSAAVYTGPWQALNYKANGSTLNHSTRAYQFIANTPSSDPNGASDFQMTLNGTEEALAGYFTAANTADAGAGAAGNYAVHGDTSVGYAFTDSSKNTVFSIVNTGTLATDTITLSSPLTTSAGITNTGTITTPTLVVTGTTTLATGLTGLLIGTSGVVSATTTSAGIAGAISDETGTGSLVFSASPALTGTPTAPTASVATNTTQVATTAFVLANAGATITVQTGTLVGGTSTKTVPSGCHPWVQDNAASLTNVGSLVVTVSGTTATITSTNVLDTSPFTLYNAGSQ